MQALACSKREKFGTKLPILYHRRKTRSRLCGGRNKDRNLTITVSTTDGSGGVAANASITVEITDPDSTVATLSGTTDASGEFAVSFSRAASGLWSTAVTDLDGQTAPGTPFNEFDKGTDASGTQFCN